MSTKLMDGSWTPIEEIGLAFDTFKRHHESGEAKHFVSGTKDEVQSLQQTIDRSEENKKDIIEKLMDEMNSLKNDMSQLKMKSETILKIPTQTEVERFSKVTKSKE